MKNTSNIIFPAAPEDFSETLRQASRAGQKVSIRGYSTQGKTPPDRTEVNTGRCNKILDIFSKDLVMKAQAGVSIDKLNESLMRYNLAIEGYTGSLGGFLMGADISGGQYQWRQRVLGMTFITGGGEIMNYGSMSVKDVTGYRMMHFLLGTRGRLGAALSFYINLAPAHRIVWRKPQNISAVHEISEPVVRITEGIERLFDPAGILNKSADK
ncbi:FAD-binding oxidoreductase [bacterium]|nr:FAD-binding oxidoreductase [bacterium]